MLTGIFVLIYILSNKFLKYTYFIHFVINHAKNTVNKIDESDYLTYLGTVNLVFGLEDDQFCNTTLRPFYVT